MIKKTRKTKTTIDDLARMIKRGFDDVDGRFDKIEKEIKDFKEENRREHKEMREENQREHKEMQDDNQREHEEIKMRLDDVAYRFESVKLEKRIEVLEEKMKA